MSAPFSRRGLFRLLGAAAVITTIRPAQPGTILAAEPISPTETATTQPRCDDEARRCIQPTQLERFLRSRGIRPAHVAREAGYARQQLLRIRMGQLAASGSCAVAVTYALRRLTGEAVVLADVFPVEVVAAAWRERRQLVRAYHPFERRSVRTVFGRRA